LPQTKHREKIIVEKYPCLRQSSKTVNLQENKFTGHKFLQCNSPQGKFTTRLFTAKLHHEKNTVDKKLKRYNVWYQLLCGGSHNRQNTNQEVIPSHFRGFDLGFDALGVTLHHSPKKKKLAFETANIS
jgi:hypothetical protein